MAIRLLVEASAHLEAGERAQVTITSKDGDAVKHLIFVTTRGEGNTVRTAVYEADTLEEFLEMFQKMLGGTVPLDYGQKPEPTPTDQTVDEMFADNEIDFGEEQS